MKDTIYLIANRDKITRMTKNLPDLYKGEIPIKLNVTVDPNAYGEPVVAKDIFIDDWTQGIKFDDVEFQSNIITEQEASKIKQMRLERMTEILQQNGYKIEKAEVENEQA